MFCTSCGRELKSNYPFCPFCGKKVKNSEFKNTETCMMDPKCHVWFVCPKCGRSFERWGTDLNEIKFGKCICGFAYSKESHHNKNKELSAEADLLFEAKKMNGGMIQRNSGEWLNTCWKVYRNGTVTKESEYDKWYNYSTGQVEDARIYRSQYQMNTYFFKRFWAISQWEFPWCSAHMVYDGVYWDMKSYYPNGFKRHCISGGIDHNATLKSIVKLLEESEELL